MRLVIAIGILIIATAAFAQTSTEWDGTRPTPSTPYSYEPDGTLALTNVAIFRDQIPWGYTTDDDILMAHSIAFTVHGSADIGTVDLSVYDKVIISNQQPLSFNDAVTNNVGWFESYANAGGILLLGMAHYTTDIVIGQTFPGGYAMMTQNCNNVVIIMDPMHELFNVPNVIAEADLQGWSCSSHGDLNAPGGSVTLLQNNDFDFGPAVAEMTYGAGTIIATTQPYQWGGAPIAYAENLVLYEPQGTVAVESTTLTNVKELFR